MDELMYESGGSGGRENVAFSLKPIPNGSRLHQLDPQALASCATAGTTDAISWRPLLVRKVTSDRTNRKGEGIELRRKDLRWQTVSIAI